MQKLSFTAPLAATLAAATWLVGCAAMPDEPHATLDHETIAYQCAEAVSMQVIYRGRATGLQGTAELIWDGKSFPLQQEASGSGGRYTDGTLTLVTKGDEAFVEKTGEVVLRDCNAKT